jgi:hypothetical protein
MEKSETCFWIVVVSVKDAANSDELKLLMRKAVFFDSHCFL